MKTVNKLWIALIVLIILCPLGLILPDKMGAGSAWGEWGADEMEKMVGYVPAGMKKLADVWNAPMPDYAFRGQEEAPLKTLSVSYIVSGVVGVLVVSIITLILGRIIGRRESPKPS
jgi:hypothetical protein